jgi:hypothetical protein
MEPSARTVVCVSVDNVKTRDSLLTSAALIAFIGAILSATDAMAEPGKGHTRIIRPSDPKGADHAVADTALGADAAHDPPPAGEEIVFEVRYSYQSGILHQRSRRGEAVRLLRRPRAAALPAPAPS